MTGKSILEEVNGAFEEIIEAAETGLIQTNPKNFDEVKAKIVFFVDKIGTQGVSQLCMEEILNIKNLSAVTMAALSCFVRAVNDITDEDKAFRDKLERLFKEHLNTVIEETKVKTKEKKDARH